MACSSASGSAAYFLALTWTWSPWMKSGPVKPSRSAAAVITATYSPGRLLALLRRAEHGLAHELVQRRALARGGALEPAERRVGCVGHGAILLASNLDRAHLDDQPVVRGRDARRQLGRELGVGRRVR